jgi:hypothetical protein
VVIPNGALVAPAGTVTDWGTRSAAVLLDASDTMIPPLGAGPLSLAVPVAVRLPVIDVGLTETVLRATGLKVIVVAREAPLSAARTVNAVAVVTNPVVIVIVLLVLPTGIVIVPGNGKIDVSPPESVTTAADPRAAPLRVTLSLRTEPPEADVGLNATDATCSGATVIAVVFVTPP